MSDEAGFTLVEVIVALALFALIALAGLALVEGVLGIRERTAGRLERLADIRRALFVIDSDLAQLADGPIAGGGAMLSFVRSIGPVATPVRYALAGGTAMRDVGGVRQVMLPGVGGWRFRFWTGTAWIDRWPVEEAHAMDRPVAVAAEIALDGPPLRGTVRRVVVLPVRP